MTPVRNLAYLCFTPSTKEDEAARKFAEKYGNPPEYIFEYKRLLWCGPIREEENDHDTESTIDVAGLA